MIGEIARSDHPIPVAPNHGELPLYIFRLCRRSPARLEIICPRPYLADIDRAHGIVPRLRFLEAGVRLRPKRRVGEGHQDDLSVSILTHSCGGRTCSVCTAGASAMPVPPWPDLQPDPPRSNLRRSGRPSATRPDGRPGRGWCRCSGSWSRLAPGCCARWADVRGGSRSRRRVYAIFMRMVRVPSRIPMRCCAIVAGPGPEPLLSNT